MTTLDRSSTPLKPVWTRSTTLLTAGVGAVLLATSWSMLACGKPTWVPLSLTGLAAVLSGVAYALNTRHQAGRLLGFGKKYVQVRSLDEWTLYQYGLLFERSSPEQQNEAIKHYRVGLRLFPTRPQDMAPKQSSWQWLLAMRVCYLVGKRTWLVQAMDPDCHVRMGMGVHAPFQALYRCSRCQQPDGDPTAIVG